MKLTKGMKRRDEFVSLLKSHGWTVSSRSSEILTHTEKNYRLRVTNTAIHKEIHCVDRWASRNGGVPKYLKDAMVEEKGIFFNDHCFVAW